MIDTIYHLLVTNGMIMMMIIMMMMMMMMMTVMEKYIQQVPRNIKIHELQKITLLGTSHILKKALSFK